MKQRLKRKRVSPALGILVIAALVAVVVALSAVVYVLTDMLRALGVNAAFMQYAQYVLLIVLGIFIVRRYMTEYEYALVDDELIVDRYIGDRARNLLRIKLSSIVSVGSRKPNLRLQRLTFMPQHSGVVYIVYSENATQKCAYLSPNEELVELISQRRGC